MAVLGPFQAQDGERRIYFNGHDMAGQKVWVVEGREGKCLVKSTRRCDRDKGVDYVRTVLKQLKDSGRIAETWPEFETLYAVAHDVVREGWRGQGKSLSEHERRDPSYGFEGFASRCELLVDPDADKDVLEHLSGIPNLSLVEQQLEAGHFACRDDSGVTLLVMERAARQEFVAALTEDEGGLFLHAQRIRRMGAQAVVLLEGDIFAEGGTSLGEISSALSFLAVAQGISIVPTANARHTAYTIARMVRHALYGFRRDVVARDHGPLGAAAAGHGNERMAAAIAFIAGVGPGRARQVMEAFPNLKAVANASVEELMQVDFIGRGTAEAIVKAFTVERVKEDG